MRTYQMSNVERSSRAALTWARHDGIDPAPAPPELELSVVVPVHNEAESLPALYQRLTEVLAGGPP
ncbi:MAG TPA: hypothetical protein VNL77_18355, partial [Roseiflexaceae bacterium]|nr:hypothetical protein [Roseiflexaceae bacterium]